VSLLSLGREVVITEKLFLWLFPSAPGTGVLYIKTALSLRLILKRRIVRVIIIIIQQWSLCFLLSMVSFMGMWLFPEEDHEPRWQDPSPEAKTPVIAALCLKVSKLMVS